jgi:hypothetical protein
LSIWSVTVRVVDWGTPAALKRAKPNGSETAWYVPLQVRLTPPIPVAMKSPGAADEVVTVPDVIADDADAEHGALAGQGLNEGQIVKAAEVAEVIPGLVATRVYPTPGRLILRSENEAMPPLAETMTVPDSVPEPGFDPIATVTFAREAVASWPHPFRTSTMTGPRLEPTGDVITVPAAVSVGSLVNASDNDPVGVPLRQVDVHPAAGTAVTPTPSTLAASTKKETRATMKPAFGMATPHLYQPKSASAPARSRSAGNPLCIRTYPLGIWIVLLRPSFSVIRLPVYHARSRW